MVEKSRSLEQINAQNTKLDEIQAKKGKISRTESNDTFGNVEQIRATKDEQQWRINSSCINGLGCAGSPDSW